MLVLRSETGLKNKNGQRSRVGTGAVCECYWRTKTSQCACVIQCGEVDFWWLRDMRENKRQASSINCNSMGGW